ncbi:SigB/SigF/SigG family RNA polymerase sigma factor [Kineosporia rhizophila]|uniref:SigB/SigF/SigG family RNA polymerase sigma factor n=1 Tax=Kineosporia rhizophila TaxID=84633 RepID=UPI001E2B7FC0|nr:SigB/SigF/SigG family RNA polymerase sigma factor [Kineosporia rhizophila]
MIQQQETTLSVLQRTPRRDDAPDSDNPRAAGPQDEPALAGQPSPGTVADPVDGPAAGPAPVQVPERTVPAHEVAARLREQDSDLDEAAEAATEVRRRGRHVREDAVDAPPPADPNLLRLAALPKTDPQYQQLRRTVIEAHLPLVHHLAQRFKGRGEPYDDLVQVGTIGLLHAVDRFDPQRGAFAAFAVPTIVGEIRRHFRDRGWAMRIPRRIQDLGRRVSEARETLTHTLDRSPTVQEIAQHLDVDADMVIEALDTASAYITVPLPTTAEESDRMGKSFEDAGLELVEQRETLRPLLARLPEREQRILELRFGKGLSQAQIATEVGVSQMHVSRLLTKSLNILRSGLTEEL